MKNTRRYRIVADDVRTDAIAAVIASIATGVTFTAATAAIATQIDVSPGTVRTWVNDSGLRPQPNQDLVAKLRSELAAATELNRHLAARLDQGHRPSTLR